MSTLLPAGPEAEALEDQKPPQLSVGRLIIRAILALAIIAALVQFLAPHWTRVMQWGLVDNDDAMRVLQVRDWLSGQAWFDVSQHRLNPPQGGDMHWSRLGDLPLAALMAPIGAIFGMGWGAKYAAFFTPMLLGGVYIWLGTRTALALGGKHAIWPALVILISAPAALNYFLPGRVDHHGLQMILIVAAMWGLIVLGPKAAALAGLAIATGICIGLEALPLQIILIAWVAARWGLRGDAVKRETIGFGLGFALALLGLFALNVPASKWALPVNDAVGRGYVVLGCVGGFLLAGAGQLFGRTHLVGRLGALGFIGVVVLGGVAIFPEIIVPPYGKVDPLLVRLWLDNVNETEPLITTKLSRILAFACFPFLAAIGALIAIKLTKDDERDMWILAATAIIVAAALAILWQSRVAGLASAVSSIIAAAMIGKAYDRFNWKIALGAALIINPIIPGLVGAGIAKLFEPKTTTYATGGGQNCFTESSFGALAKMPHGLVIAPIDMGARIMLTTPHQALAAPYHRNNRGNLGAYKSFLLPQVQAKAHVRQFAATYIAICKRSAEVAILARQAPQGLMADLKVGRTPDWLIPLQTPKGSDVVAYQIKQGP
jgi:asparagine N-glycosylation enzyme membrane subunit Stt3